MTESERNSRFDDHEPVLGHEPWYKVLWYRLGLLLFVDIPSKAFVFFAIMCHLSYKMLEHTSDVVGIGIILIWGLSALNWTMRKYAGPFVEAICDWIRGAKNTLTNQAPPPPPHHSSPKADDES